MKYKSKFKKSLEDFGLVFTEYEILIPRDLIDGMFMSIIPLMMYYRTDLEQIEKNVDSFKDILKDFKSPSSPKKLDKIKNKGKLFRDIERDVNTKPIFGYHFEKDISLELQEMFQKSIECKNMEEKNILIEEIANFFGIEL